MEKSERRGRVLPFFVVADESGSMAGDPIESINSGLPRLHDAVVSDPVVSDKVRFGLISFAGDAQVLLGLSDLSELTALPGLTARDGGTNYAAAFDVLRVEIASEIARLTSDGFEVLRPAVFFLSDGQPNGPEWKSLYSALIAPENPARPNIIAFGIGQANPDIIRQVGTLAAFMASTTDPSDAVHEFAVALTRSVVASGSALASGTGALHVANPTGFVSLPLDPVTVP